ncbi:hypothetical protein JXL83_09615 [candidate division WOR-3 bacterium]|nr:hypothetical protein [candidate division WOR-3 bacterium]
MGKRFFDNIFADPPEDLALGKELSEEKKKNIIEKLSKEIVRRELTVPAIVFFESVKPLSFIGSQAMIFFDPIVQIVFPTKMYAELQSFFEDRENVEKLIQGIEEEDARYSEEKKRKKEENKNSNSKKGFFRRWKRRSDEAEGTDKDNSRD